MFVITDKGGTKVAAFFQEDSEYAKSQVVAAVLAGMNVVHERGGPEVLSQGRRNLTEAAPARPSTWQKPRVSKRKPHNAQPAIEHQGDDETEFTVGEQVYLNWPTLSDPLRLNLSSQRLAKGQIVEFRSGKGVRRTIGVRFNSDPELTWLAPAEIAYNLHVED